MGAWARGGGLVWRSVAVVGLLSTPAALTACSTSCDKSAPAQTIVGLVIARTDSAATFSIESVSIPRGAASEPAAPVLVRGRTVEVSYFADHAKYLRVGTRYRVDLSWNRTDGFASDVHTSDEPCSGGTVYADGSSINTASWTRSHIVEIVLAVVLAPIALAVIVLIVLRTLLRIYRRRRGLSDIVR